MKRTDKGMIRNVDSATVAVQHGKDIKTTLDINIQDIADRALRKQIQADWFIMKVLFTTEHMKIQFLIWNG